jgi:biotin carboxyl carrier protein
MTSKNKKTIDRKPIEDLSTLLEELNLTEISYQEGDFAISVSRAVKGVVSNSSSTNTIDSQSQTNNEGDYSSDPRAIKSPMVGHCLFAA